MIGAVIVGCVGLILVLMMWLGYYWAYDEASAKKTTNDMMKRVRKTTNEIAKAVALSKNKKNKSK